jgi:hypothetical protein
MSRYMLIVKSTMASVAFRVVADPAAVPYL